MHRRHFLQSSAATGASLLAPSLVAAAAPPASANDRLVLGYVGAGIRFHGLIGDGCGVGPCAAVCDVDAVQRGRGVQSAREQHYEHGYPISIYNYDDYRRVLDRQDIDAVVIATPDHWHAKIAIEAMQSGKDVYCEKPLTLTIEEGRLIAQAEAQTGRVVQVGAQQRSDVARFGTAAALVRSGRIGSVKQVTCAIGTGLSSGPIPKAPCPKHLNWDAWLGQAPMVDYRAAPTIEHVSGYGSGHPMSRTHNYFRNWYEYAGGKLTDWGAHHVDIAMWALDKSGPDVGPYTLDPVKVVHPAPLDSNGMPVHDDRYNTATEFLVRVTFADGVRMDIIDDARDLGFENGIMFTGDQGRFFVNRGKLTGKPVEDLGSNPLPEDALRQLYGRKPPASHMMDFAHCVRMRETPVSDVESHHRHLTVCHAANIALRLGRRLTFDPKTESFLGDQQANGFVAREQRKGYEVKL